MIDITEISLSEAVKRSLLLAGASILLTFSLLLLGTSITQILRITCFVAPIVFCIALLALVLRHYCFACKSRWSYVMLGKDKVHESDKSFSFFGRFYVTINIKHYIVDYGCTKCYTFKRLKRRHIASVTTQTIQTSYKQKPNLILKIYNKITKILPF